MMTEKQLPPKVTEKDLTYPSMKSKDHILYTAGNHGTLTFYLTDKMGWCISTLPISQSRKGYANRTYAIRIEDGSIVTVGNGPHVKVDVMIYIRNSRIKVLQEYVELYNKGMIEAGNIRDRISSRRAQGQVMRSQGRRSWLWNT